MPKLDVELRTRTNIQSDRSPAELLLGWWENGKRRLGLIERVRNIERVLWVILALVASNSLSFDHFANIVKAASVFLARLTLNP